MTHSLEALHTILTPSDFRDLCIALGMNVDGADVPITGEDVRMVVSSRNRDVENRRKYRQPTNRVWFL